MICYLNRPPNDHVAMWYLVWNHRQHDFIGQDFIILRPPYYYIALISMLPPINMSLRNMVHSSLFYISQSVVVGVHLAKTKSTSIISYYTSTIWSLAHRIKVYLAKQSIYFHARKNHSRKIGLFGSPGVGTCNVQHS